MESNEIKLSYEACVEELKIAQRNLIAYQNENESLKRENENLRGVIEERNHTIDLRNSTLSAYKECFKILAKGKKR